MDLRELRLVISRYLPIAFIVFAICVAAGFAAAYLPAKSYRTTATIVLDVNADSAAAAGGGSVQQASFLLPAIQERAASRSMRDRATDDVPEAVRSTRVTIGTDAEDSVLRITGTSHSPVAAQEWVNAIAGRLIAEQSDESPFVLGLLDEAPIKRAPIAPNTTLIMTSFVVLGFIAALFSTLIADRVKRAFDTSQTIRDQLGTTVLGEVPAIRGRADRSRPIVALLDSRNTRSDLTGAFEAIRTNVEFRMAQVGADRVAVVSIGRSSAKSAITAGLGYMLAAAGRRVVAIEADLRRPMLAEHLGVQPKVGLSDIAAFGNEMMILQPTSHPRLELLSAGYPAGRASDVIATALPTVLDDLTDGSRTLLVDSAPLEGAPESAIVMSLTHHVILVVANRSADFSKLTSAVERINESGASLLGVVIDGVSRRRSRRNEVRSTTSASRRAAYAARTVPPVDAADESAERR